MTARALTTLDVPSRLSRAVSGFAPIELEELTERAALQTRIDRKYVVPVRALGPLLAGTPSTARVLEIDGRRTFGYRSTYLDTPELDCFFLAGRRRRRRFKVRTRTYLDTGSSWLEVKTRTARGATVKHRVAHQDETHLGSAGFDFVNEELAQARVYGTRSHSLAPVLVTSYQRSTLFLPESTSRVTIDVDLGWSSVLNRRDLDRPHLAVVETKTGSSPSPVDRLLWASGHRPVRLSKFGAGMVALHPGLPDLKWHDALRRHLDISR